MTERISDERLAEFPRLMSEADRRREIGELSFRLGVTLGHLHNDDSAELLHLLRMLASLREQTRWRPMEEAPRDGTAILASLVGRGLLAVVRYRYGGWVVAWDHYRLDSGPRCWMPLPEIGTLPGGDA